MRRKLLFLLSIFFLILILPQTIFADTSINSAVFLNADTNQAIYEIGTVKNIKAKLRFSSSNEGNINIIMAGYDADDRLVTNVVWETTTVTAENKDSVIHTMNNSISVGGVNTIKVFAWEELTLKPVLTPNGVLNKVFAADEGFVQKLTAAKDVTQENPLVVVKGNPVLASDVFETVNGAQVNSEFFNVSGASLDSAAVDIDFAANTLDWRNATLTFNATGLIKLTAFDYDFCIPAYSYVNVIEPIDRYYTKFENTDDYLYRVGNKNTVSLSSLFAVNESIVPISDMKVEIATKEGNATGTYTPNTSDWSLGTIKFSGTGVVDTVTLPASAITAVEALGEDATLNITLANGEDADVEVSINKEALAVIKDAANDAGEDVILKVEQTDELADAQNNTLADLDNGVVYRVSLETKGGTPIYAETGAEDGRNIEIKIYYSKSSTGKVLVRVKHLKDDGTLEDVDFGYDDNIVTMNLAHFSEYVIYETRISSGITPTGSSAAVSKYTVTFDTDGGSAVASQRVEKNDKVSEPAAPTKEGYIFDGWYTDDTFETAYDFETLVTKSFTLYAKWTEATEEEPSTDEPAETVTFNDVKAEDWFSEDVKFVSENGLMNGVTETEFAPDTLLTRAMLVTILYRNEGEPATNRSIPFADIDMGAYYASAVIWAQQNGIVNGVTETEFVPNANITREQIAAIMFRYAIHKGLEAVTLEENLTAFADAEEISEYAISALNWAVGSGLINGKTDSTLCPKDNATRAEIAAILHRYIVSQK